MNRILRIVNARPILPSWLSSGCKSLNQTRQASILSQLQMAPGAYHKAKRLGRGPASGLGKTSGRGQKGQWARQRVPLLMEGGQTPINRRFPKWGKRNQEKKIQILGLGRLQEWIDAQRIDPSAPITMKDIYDARLVHSDKVGVKLLGNEEHALKQPINIYVSKASAKAIEQVEATGGKITTVYHNKLGYRALLHPHKFTRLPRQARPIRRKDIDYYANADNRGFLCDEEVLERLYPGRRWVVGKFMSQKSMLQNVI